MAEWIEPVLRLLHYALLLGLFGWIAFRVIGLRRVNIENDDHKRMIVVLGAAVVVPFVSAALMLVSIAAMMGQSVSQLEWTMVEVMVLSINMGWAFLARMVLLSVALSVLLGRRVIPAALPIVAMLYGLALATLAWSGHAAASEGIWGLTHRLNDGIHLIVAGLWIGAIGWFLILTIQAHQNPDSIAPDPLLEAMHRFAPLGVILVAVVAATGLVNAQLTFGIANSLSVLGTSYGWMLAAKLVLVGLMLLLGARNASIVRRPKQTGDGNARSKAATLVALRISLTWELSVAVVIIGLVAILGMASPID
jgi:putative copper resistance protein D